MSAYSSVKQFPNVYNDDLTKLHELIIKKTQMKIILRHFDILYDSELMAYLHDSLEIKSILVVRSFQSK